MPAPPRLLDHVSPLQYVTVDKAPTYRAVVEIFFSAKERYIVELRPAEVQDRLMESDLFHEVGDATHLDYFLDRLVEWGNLARSHDAEGVSRLEDFYRRRFSYRLSATGEAAHRAVREVEATLGRSGSLQATMLEAILDRLRELSAAEASPDQLFRALGELHQAFSTLVDQANRFIGDRGEVAETLQLDDERFVLRKEALLAYISRFVDQLRRLADGIKEGIRRVEEAGLALLLARAARSGDLPPALDERDPVALWLEEQRARWEGVRRWFVGEATTTPTVERLADVAVQAVVGLTRTLGRLNERRNRPIDRAADFRTLACWFADTVHPQDAEALWSRAFGLGSARHFHLAEEDAELTGPNASWWEAEPVAVPIRLRTRGRLSHGGRAATVPDRGQERMFIAARRRRERAQIEAVMERIAAAGRLSLSELSPFDEQELDMVFALIDEALATPRGSGGIHEARTVDGRYRIRLGRPNGAPVTLQTPRGLLRCLDYQIELVRLVGGFERALRGQVG